MFCLQVTEIHLSWLCPPPTPRGMQNQRFRGSSWIPQVEGVWLFQALELGPGDCHDQRSLPPGIAPSLLDSMAFQLCCSPPVCLLLSLSGWVFLPHEHLLTVPANAYETLIMCQAVQILSLYQLIYSSQQPVKQD